MRKSSARSQPEGIEAVSDFRVFHGKHDYFPYTVGMHYHEHYEVLFHGHGGKQLVIGQSLYQMGEHDLYIIPPFYIHGILTDVPLTGYERTYLHITPEFLSVLGLTEVSYSRQLDRLVSSGTYRFQLSPEAHARLESQLIAVSNLSDCPTSYERLSSIFRLGIFCNEICHTLVSSSLSVEPDNPGRPVLQQVFSYIGTHCTEDLSLDSLAQQFNLSKYYLSHLFSQTYHVSVYRYILMCRIAMAQKLIPSGDSLTSIAQRCGFNDYSNFLRAFHQITGSTPRAYQQKLQYRP